MASGMFLYGKHVASGAVDLDTDTIKMMVLTSSYTPDYDTHDFRNDVTAFEIGNTGTYAAGGSAAASKTLTVDTTNNRMVFDCADVSWTGTTIADARYLVFYKSRGGASSADELVYCLDFGEVKTTSAGTLGVTFNASGVFGWAG